MAANCAKCWAANWLACSPPFAAAHAVTDHEHALLRESGVLVVFAPKAHVTGHRDTDGACGHDAFPFLRVRLTCVVCGFAACPFDSIATLFRESRVRILLKRGKEASIALRNWSTPAQYVVAWPDSMSCPETWRSRLPGQAGSKPGHLCRVDGRWHRPDLDECPWL